jgi:hypothetical protein
LVSTKPAGKALFLIANNNRYTCEAKGVHLPYKKTYGTRRATTKSSTAAVPKTVANCPLRTTCIGGRADYKKIEDTVDKHLYDEMHARLQNTLCKADEKAKAGHRRTGAGHSYQLHGH